MRMKAIILHAKDRYINFVEHHGFHIIVTVCIAVITATAVWTGNRHEPYVSPTPPLADHVSAAQLLQQSLADAATPIPTASPRQWYRPLDVLNVLQGYHNSKFVQNKFTGIWAIHDAVDLQCSPGEKVFAMSDGIVISVGKDKAQHAWIHIDHGDGIEAYYSGMKMTAAYIAGDKVSPGAVIGYGGASPMHESDLPPHLHLRVTRNGVSINPFSLWQN